MAARRMSSSLSRTSSSTASMTFGPPILPSASPARLRTHQSSSLSACSRYLTERASPTSLSTSTADAARLLALVLEHRHQVPDGFRVARLAAAARPRGSAPRSPDRAAGCRRARRRSDRPSWRARPAWRCGSPCWCPDLRLQRALHFRLVEARQDVDDVQPRDRILALQPPDQLRQRRLVGGLGDDAEQRRLLVGLLGSRRRSAARARRSAGAGR